MSKNDGTYEEYKRVFANRTLPRGGLDLEIFEQRAAAARSGIGGITLTEQTAVIERRLDNAVAIFKRGHSADAYAAIECCMAALQAIDKERQDERKKDDDRLPGSGRVANAIAG